MRSPEALGRFESNDGTRRVLDDRRILHIPPFFNTTHHFSTFNNFYDPQNAVKANSPACKVLTTKDLWTFWN